MREFVSHFAGDMRILISCVLLCLQYCLPRIYCGCIDSLRRLDTWVRGQFYTRLCLLQQQQFIVLQMYRFLEEIGYMGSWAILHETLPA